MARTEKRRTLAVIEGASPAQNFMISEDEENDQVVIRSCYNASFDRVRLQKDSLGDAFDALSDADREGRFG